MASTLAKVRALMGSDRSRLNTPAPVQPTSVTSSISIPSVSATLTEADRVQDRPHATHSLDKMRTSYFAPLGFVYDASNRLGARPLVMEIR